MCVERRPYANRTARSKSAARARRTTIANAPRSPADSPTRPARRRTADPAGCEATSARCTAPPRRTTREARLPPRSRRIERPAREHRRAAALVPDLKERQPRHAAPPLTRDRVSPVKADPPAPVSLLPHRVNRSNIRRLAFVFGKVPPRTFHGTVRPAHHHGPPRHVRPRLHEPPALPELSAAFVA